MRLEHLAGRAFGCDLSEEIFATITGYRVFPENLFMNVPQTAETLRRSFDLQRELLSAGAPLPERNGESRIAQGVAVLATFGEEE